jgi:hypothetical protein
MGFSFLGLYLSFRILKKNFMSPQTAIFAIVHHNDWTYCIAIENYEQFCQANFHLMRFRPYGVTERKKATGFLTTLWALGQLSTRNQNL